MTPTPAQLNQVLTLARSLSTATDWTTIETLTTGLDPETKAITWGTLTQADRDRIRTLKPPAPGFDPAQCVQALRGCPLYFYVQDVLDPLTEAQRPEVMALCDPKLTRYIETLRSNWDEFPAFDYPEGCELSPFRYWVRLNEERATKGRSR